MLSLYWGAEAGEADAVCMVTRAASHATVGLESNTDAMQHNDSMVFVPDLSNLSFSFKDLGKEQREGSSLSELFGTALSGVGGPSAARGYFV